MIRLALTVVVVLVSVGAANGQQGNTPANASQTPSSGSFYDPMARAKGIGQPKGIVETTLAGVNPRNTDYGVTVEDWRKGLFEHTIDQVYFWILILLFLALGSSVMANGWLMREREQRLSISADIVAQLYNAYVGSRAKALEVISKYNSLVERHNRLDEELKRAQHRLAGAQAQSSTAQLDYNQAKQDKESEPIAGSERLEDVSDDLATEPVDVNALQSKLAEYENKFQRKNAQLQAKENQITNLRERLTRAHNSLEGQRQQKSSTK
jgi:hypothetical protein